MHLLSESGVVEAWVHFLFSFPFQSASAAASMNRRPLVRSLIRLCSFSDRPVSSGHENVLLWHGSDPFLLVPNENQEHFHTSSGAGRNRVAPFPTCRRLTEAPEPHTFSVQFVVPPSKREVKREGFVRRLRGNLPCPPSHVSHFEAPCSLCGGKGDGESLGVAVAKANAGLARGDGGGSVSDPLPRRSGGLLGGGRQARARRLLSQRVGAQRHVRGVRLIKLGTWGDLPAPTQKVCRRAGDDGGNAGGTGGDGAAGVIGCSVERRGGSGRDGGPGLGAEVARRRGCKKEIAPPHTV